MSEAIRTTLYSNGCMNWLAHGPTLNAFLDHLESEFEDVYFFRFGSP